MMRLGKSVRAIAAWLRLLPVLAWLAVQLSMAGMPVTEASAAHPHDPDLAALFEALGEDRVELCTPEGKQVVEQPGNHAGHSECEWCQGFSASVRPAEPEVTALVRHAAAPDSTAAPEHRATSQNAQTCHPCRAPPAPI